MNMMPTGLQSFFDLYFKKGMMAVNQSLTLLKKKKNVFIISDNPASENSLMCLLFGQYL